MDFINGFEHGQNPTTLVAQTVFNARVVPDIETYRTNHGDRALYKRVDDRGPDYQLAHKGNLAFQITGIPELNYEPDDLNDRDMAYAASDLNGLFDKKTFQNNMHLLLEHISVIGIWNQDILSNFNTGKNTTVATNGKKTIGNTGNRVIHGGQLVMWDLPDPDPQALRDSGANKFGDRPQHSAPLWTVPYDPAIHECTPVAVYKFHKSMRNGNGNLQNNASKNKGYAHATKTLGEEFLRVGYAVIKALQAKGINCNDDDALKEALVRQPANESKRTEDLVSNVMDEYLGYVNNNGVGPLDDSQLERLSGTLERRKKEYFSTDGRNIVAGGILGRFTPNSSGRAMADTTDTSVYERNRVVSAQRLFESMDYLQGFYRDRIFGRAITSAIPGRDLDVIVHNTRR